MGLSVLVRIGFWLVIAAVAAAFYGFGELVQTPRVVEYRVEIPGWRAKPAKVVLLSDIHVIAPDMTPGRVRRIVREVNAQAPDIVLLAGDFTSRRIIRTRRVTVQEAIAPLAGLAPARGSFAVLGNHDMEVPGRADAVEAALTRAGITVLRNRSAAAGDIRIAGVDDGHYGIVSMPRALEGIRPRDPVLFLVHNPDAAAGVPPWVPLVLAGHTHGGQIAPPGIGPLVTGTRRGWVRGLYLDRGRYVLVTSGLGASLIPIRLGVRPEIVVVRVTAAPPA